MLLSAATAPWNNAPSNISSINVYSTERGKNMSSLELNVYMQFQLLEWYLHLNALKLAHLLICHSNVPFWSNSPDSGRTSPLRTAF